MGRDQRACLLTLVERCSGYAIIKKLTARTAAQANQAVGSALAEHRGRVETLTFDNGTEFHSYKQIEARFPVICYFATPYHSWERGSNDSGVPGIPILQGQARCPGTLSCRTVLYCL